MMTEGNKGVEERWTELKEMLVRSAEEHLRGRQVAKKR